MKNFIKQIGFIGFIGQSDAPQPNPISGIGPTIGFLFDGMKLGDAVTWGTYQPSGASVVREMQKDSGAWVPFDAAVSVSAGETWAVRETVTFGVFTKQFASDLSAVWYPDDLFAAGNPGHWSAINEDQQ